MTDEVERDISERVAVQKAKQRAKRFMDYAQGLAEADYVIGSVAYAQFISTMASGMMIYSAIDDLMFAIKQRSGGLKPSDSIAGRPYDSSNMAPSSYDGGER